jgi:hypothetical protein
MTKISMPLADLQKAIDAFGKQGAKWADQGHKLGIAALEHLKANGDIGPCNRLYLAVVASKGGRAAAMTGWLLSYGSLVANTDKDTKAEKPFVFAKDKEVKLELAAKDPWYNHKPDAAPDEVFDVQKAIAAILKKAASFQKAGKQVKGSEVLGDLEALAGGEKKNPSTEPGTGAETR